MQPAVLPAQPLFVLLLPLLSLSERLTDSRTLNRRSPLFKFTRGDYNATIPENSRGRVYATPQLPVGEKMGVFLPNAEGSVKFKIVSGDPQNYFKASARTVGDFAFLRLRTRQSLDLTLNRELKHLYPLLVKATFRHPSRRIETRSSVNLLIADRNDLAPLFLDARYAVTVDDDLAVFSQIARVKASDADQGISGQVYYSFVEPTPHFSVHPVSGAVSLLRGLDADSAPEHRLTVQAEDRASRLASKQKDVWNGPTRPPSTAELLVTVRKANAHAPEMLVQTSPIQRLVAQSQTAALIRVRDADSGAHGEIADVRLDLQPSDEWRDHFLIVPASNNDSFLLRTVPGRPLQAAPGLLNLTVLASDSGSPPRTTRKSFEVVVEHRDPPQLQFAVSTFEFYVNESAPIWTPIGFASLSDSDLFREFANSLQFELLDNGLPFALNAATGLLSVGGRLDFEKRRLYEFKVGANFQDGSQTAESVVKVHVLDTNDNDPVFELEDLEWTLAETAFVESAVGRVSATDVDSGDNGKISYRLLNDPELPFLLDQATGEVILRRPLTASDPSEWHLQIRATDWGKPLRREVEMFVKVRRQRWQKEKVHKFVHKRRRYRKDLNSAPEKLDNRYSPAFSKEIFEVKVKEDAAVNEVLAQFSAQDADRGYAGLVQYVLDPVGNEDSYFKVDTSTGELSLMRPLYYGSPKQFDLTLRSSDLGVPQGNGSANLRINIEDVNDHSPRFLQPFYRVEIAENIPPNRDVIKVTAEDNDLNTNAEIRYSILTKTDDFRIDEDSGMISVNAALDRELLPAYKLKVSASDAGARSLSAESEVRIDLVDVNDNPPRCLSRLQRVQILEDWPVGALISCLSAFDPDSGSNGQFTFEFDPTQDTVNLPVSIDAESGCVFVAGPLDFETKPLYNLSIEVTDKGSPQYSSLCHLLVELIDVDENRFPPLFEDFVVSAAVFENEPVGTEVITVSARDPDFPDDKPAYSIVAGDGYGLFSINPTGTIRTTSILDRETKASYWLTVSATDGSNFPRSSNVDVFIQVSDRNDRAPWPLKPIYFASVLENSPMGAFVTTVDAVDPDKGNSAGLRYRISRGDPQSFFTIDEKTGYISTHRRKLDREAQAERELEVTITDLNLAESSDSASASLSTAVSVVVKIADENDSPPKFERKIYNFNIPAVLTDDGGRLFCRVFASDDDEGANAELRYEITEGDVGGHFGIHPESGEIFARLPLNEMDSFALTVTAHDSGSPPLFGQTRVMLAVLPAANKTANDGAPVLISANPTQLHIAEGEAVGQTVGLVEADDPDGDQLWFRIVGGNTNDVFSLRGDTGEFQIARNLRLIDSSDFEIGYTVTDGIESVSGTFKITIQRSVDVRPQFLQKIYETRVRENAAVGTELMQLNVSLNSTSDSSTELTYFLHAAETPSTASKFKVEPQTGRLVLVEALNHEAQRFHKLIVAARFKQLVNFAVVEVQVLDENDFAPKFDGQAYEGRVFETAAVGSVVLRLAAFDHDSGVNGRIDYSIATGNEQGLWKLNERSGVLTVAKGLSLDFPESVLVVKATDRAESPKTDTATVRILVSAADDSAPRFTRDPYVVTVSESLPPGSLVALIFAESGNGVRYELAEAKAKEIAINPLSGLVVSTGMFDHEHQSFLNYTVRAISTSGQQAEAGIQIQIIDSNDHSPIFNDQIYEGTVAENMPAGTVVMSTNLTSGEPLVVSATDKDKATNALITYEIIDRSAAEYFSVDYGTGALRTRKELDFEKNDVFEFKIQASDLGSPSLTSAVAALVRVRVRDSNDEPPEMVLPRTVITVLLPTVKGVFVCKVGARDRDTVGEIGFEISDVAMKQLFSINETSGVVRIAAEDDSAFSEAEYKVAITLSDGHHTTSDHLQVKFRYLSSSASDLHFHQSNYSVSVVENVTSTTEQTVLVLQTIGSAIGEHVTFHLMNENPWFTMGSVSGELKSTGEPLDRETTPKLTLLIQARDRRVPPRIAQAMVTVAVQDVNDCRPRFIEQPYRAVVTLDAPIGRNVTRIRVIDLDEGVNGMVRFTLNGNGKEYFMIDAKSGMVTIEKPFPLEMQSTEYVLEVLATDQGHPPLSATAPLIVRVVNKAMPVFDKAAYSTIVKETATVGELVLKLRAISNVGGTIGYAIVDGDADSTFALDYITGNLVLQRKLDREAISMFNLTVRGIDVERRRAHADVSVQVEVLDSNDNAPQFPNTTFRMRIPESTPVGTKFARLWATDADAGDNAEISYSLLGTDADTFEIGGDSGDLSLAKMVDFDAKKSYNFIVKAADHGAPNALTGSANVTVELTDVNDNAPQFKRPLFEARLSDDSPPGQFVISMFASDVDTVSSGLGDARLLYSVIDGDAQPAVFELNRQTGLVKTARGVDLSAVNRQYNLNVSVSDGAFTAYTQLRVDVIPSVSKTDPPRFDRTEFEAAVKENGLPQSLVTTLRAEGGVPPLVYELSSRTDTAPFEIDRNSGRLSTSEALDYERRAAYRLSLTVRDASGRQGFARITVNVIDENDNAPRFVARHFDLTVNANASAGQTIARFLATDPDAADAVEYSMYRKEGTDELYRHFKLHRKRGVLSVKGGSSNLTKLEGRRLTFFIRAMDRGNPPAQANAPVTLYVAPPTVIVPRFSDDRYQFSAAENAPIGERVGQLQLTQDFGASVRFSILPPADDFGFGAESPSAPFAVNGAGVLTTTASLDRERQSSTSQREDYRFVVEARVTGGGQADALVATALVVVRVADRNDQPPLFEPAAYPRLAIGEDAPVGASVAIVSATDPDSADTGQIEYRIENEDSGVFRMDPTTGWLLVDGPLDRETKETYHFQAVAVDSGKPIALESRANITVTLLDANDCPPKFSRENFEFKLSESAEIGSILGRFSPTDDDLPPNNRTEVFLVEGNENGLFELTASGDLILAGKVDFETARSHQLKLLASDGKFTTTAVVEISVQDENDNAPVCEMDHQALQISEGVSEGSDIFVMVADDPDSGANAILTYAVSDGDPNGDFIMNDNGILFVAKALDRETTASYDLTLGASDRDGFRCETRLHLIIRDVNDEAPVFSKSVYQVSVKENLPEGSHFLVQVRATDADLGGGGKVQFALDEESDDFLMDELTGALVVTRPLDREAADHYNLTVIATDQDSLRQLSARARVEVTVLDVNDNPPAFEQSVYEFTVEEEVALSEPIGRLTALSLDLHENALIRYRLIAADSALDHFSIHPDTGDLLLVEPLDFETQGEWVFDVEATDGGAPPLSSTCRVEITVSDLNDHSPKFAQTLYEAKIAENATIGTRVAKVLAHDLDAGPNGEIFYNLTSFATNFSISTDGWVYVASKLDRETKSEYRLQIDAIDSGESPLSDAALLKITVTDVNDNPPKFEYCNLTTTVVETAKTDTVLLEVSVWDADADFNGGPFQFTIVGNGAQHFRVDHAGQLRTAERLNYSQKDIYLLTVQVTDRGTPPLSSECPLTIRVQEESKHPPVIHPANILINSYQGEFPGGIIGKALASDKDRQDVLVFSLVTPSGDPLFTIDQTEGVLSAAPGLPVGEHSLNVSVTDGKFVDFARFTIDVQSISDETLEFAVSIRLDSVTPEVFIGDFEQKFKQSISRLLGVRPRHVSLLSVQPAPPNAAASAARRRLKASRRRLRLKVRHRRIRRANSEDARDLDVLFVVSKGKSGYLKPTSIRRRLEPKVDELAANLGLEVVGLVTEVCRRNLCVRGECRDRLTLDDLNTRLIVSSDGAAFVSPEHERSFECICQDGYGGKRCDVAVNACSGEPCGVGPTMCVPRETVKGYDCACPAGKTGEHCETDFCPEGDCAKGAATHFNGDSYVRYSLSQPLNRRLELSLEMKTIAPNGIVMFATGKADFHMLEVRGGLLRYRFDCGSGEARAEISQVAVSDGKWHRVEVSRRGRQAKLSLDDTFTAEALAPGANTVLSLRDNDVYFGADVRQHRTLYGYEDVTSGFTGCLNRISVDGFPLPRRKPGLKLYNVEFDCPSDLFDGGFGPAGPCSSSPCLNFGTCRPVTYNEFSCACHPRFTGRHCEMDLDPCASLPCTRGAQCENLYDDFFCRCEPGFTGKTCAERGDFDECISSPCGLYGQCVNIPGSFLCNCSTGWSGPLCRDSGLVPPRIDINPWGVSLQELVAVGLVFMLLVLLSACIVFLCRSRKRRYRYKKAPHYRNNDSVLDERPHNRNPNLTGGDFVNMDVNPMPPPPLPPRARGFYPSRNSKLSNLESAQLTGLPTVQVRPLSLADRDGVGSNYSPSASTPPRHRLPVSSGGGGGGSCYTGVGGGERAAQYGSAAEELEQLGRFDDLARVLDKHREPVAPLNLGGGDGDGGPRTAAEWKAALELLGDDSLERLKKHNQQQDEASQRAAPGTEGASEAVDSEAASISCLPEDAVEPSTWDRDSWNPEATEQDAMLSSVCSEADEDGNAFLPPGVSALEDTDSEWVVGEEDDDPTSGLSVPDFAQSPDFKRQLMALQRLTQPQSVNGNAHQPERIGNASSSRKGKAGGDESENEYVTMKPLNAYQPNKLERYLPRRTVGGASSQSQRRPLLDDPDQPSAHSSDSEGGDSCDAVVQYGFPREERRENVARNLKLHHYDLPPPPRHAASEQDLGARPPSPPLSSFRQIASSRSADLMQSSLVANADDKSEPHSVTDLDGICPIDDESDAADDDSLFRKSSLPAQFNQQTSV